MPTAYSVAAARTALKTLTALRGATGKTAEVKRLNAAIDVAITEAEAIVTEAERGLPPARRPAEGLRRLGES